jgi:hypothetical protein
MFPMCSSYYYETQEACHRSETGPTEEREVKRAKRKSEINVVPGAGGNLMPKT